MKPEYAAFLATKAIGANATGIVNPPEMPSHLKPFQADCVRFALRQGRAGLYLSTGLGKTRCQLEFLKHAADASNDRALMLTPLAVARQSEREGLALGYNVRVIRSQCEARDGINICNYDRLDKIDPDWFSAVSLDESSILKALTGATSRALRDIFSAHPFKMAASATPAPNDHMELGQQADFLSVMTSNEMLSRFFINDTSKASQEWRLKGHAVEAFWDWMASWSRMATLPSDLGYDDADYILPPLKVNRHKLAGQHINLTDGLFSFDASATNIHDIKRQTSGARADKAAALVHAEPHEPFVLWVDTDYEADTVRAAVGDCVEIRGGMSIDEKEENIDAFLMRQARILLTKPRIAGHGLNLQFCNRTIFVGRSFSYELWFQAVRRFWRFGQKRPVMVDIIVAEGEDQIGRVIERKESEHEKMKMAMRAAMLRANGMASRIKVPYLPKHEGRLPTWLAK